MSSFVCGKGYFGNTRKKTPFSRDVFSYASSFTKAGAISDSVANIIKPLCRQIATRHFKLILQSI